MEVSARELDPGREQQDELWAAVGAHVLGNVSSLGEKPAYATEGVADPTAFAIGESPAGISDALATIKVVENEGINQASGGHFAFIPGGGLFPAALGDLLADVGNRYAGVHFAAPAAAQMERSLVRWMSGLVGYPESAGGDLTSGASIANLEGIVTARDATGVRSADVPRTVVYLTSQTHHCIEKALRICGLAECVVRRVKLDERRRMRPDSLDATVRADVAAGLHPWLVVATAGTTETGAVDPLAAIAEIADAHELWLQVDAAYGGFFILTDHGRRVLTGIERSRTVVMDPHKGLFLPFGSGALIVRDEQQLAAAHRYSASYLSDAREAGGVFSSSDLSLELSRPFRGLRLWLPLKLFGLAPFRAALDEKLLLARYFHSRLSEMPGWLVGPEPDLSVVTYRYLPDRGDADDFNRRLLRAILADGRAVISATEINGAYTIRFAILHYRSHLDHVDGLLEVLNREATRLQAA
ncbi:MAG: aminotransferase class V-fold PLP-dependent enzyme [Actinobacteria bacterium]|nr:aminotransferase class V-fold PLP-dependent enzyme [Actinomycetota bacterium]